MNMRFTQALAALVFFCSALLFSNVRASEDPKPTPTPPPSTPPDSTKLLVRERTVYVPYEKLKETFEKEGRGVFLPYEEFLKLWNAGQPKEKPVEEVKPPTDAVISGGSYVGIAKENAVRFEVTYKIKALGKVWSELALPLKNVAVETVTISDPQAVFAPKGDSYTLLLPKPGEYTLTLAFSVRVDSKPGLRKIEFGIPPTAVSRLELSIPEKDLRVEVTPKMAATVATPEGASTRVMAFVGNADQVSVLWMPPASQIEKGEAITIATQMIQADLGERILRLGTTINYRIERNEEDTFRIKVPAGMRLLSVKGNNIKNWTAENDILLVSLHSAVKDSYSLVLRFERILEKTPEKLDIPFPATVGTLREDGYVTLAHESSLRLRVENSAGLSQLDPKELPDVLKNAALLAGFRYLAQPLSLSLKIEQIQAQIQSSVTAVTILGLDEDTMTGWVEYQISKVGIFAVKLKFESRWEVTSVGEAQTVEDFQTVVDGNYKTLTVNLKNKALGALKLPFKFTSSNRAAAGQLSLEPIQVLETQQDKGLLGVSAPKAFKLTTVERSKMASADVRNLVSSGLLSQLPPDFELPLAYSYTQQPATVKIGLEKRQTEISVTGYHSITVSEAMLEITHKLEYFIEFAGADRLQFSVPSSLDDKLLDVKCPGFKEKKKVSEANGRSIWEIALQDKVLGSVPLTISHKENLKSLEPEKPQDVLMPDVHAEGVNSQKGFIAVRKESALEIEPVAINLEPLEAVNLPAEMRSGNVYLSYRYFQPERSLTLKLIKHVPVELANTVIDLMRLTFVVSDEKQLSVRAELWVENAKGEQYLELTLPKDSVIRALAVNNVNVSPLQKKGGGTLVKLATSSTPFPVQIIYGVPLGKNEKLGLMGGLEIKALEVPAEIPLNKIEADLYIPEDYAYMNFGGTLHLRTQRDAISNTLNWIDEQVREHKSTPVIDRGDTSKFPQLAPLLGNFPTQGKKFQFQTLAPVGSITLAYCDRKLFWLFDILGCLAVVFCAWLLILRYKFSRLWVAVTLVVVPLCAEWFTTSDFGQLCAAVLCAGLLVAVVCILLRIQQALHDLREARISAMPDPFIEDAVEPSKSQPAQADGSAQAETDSPKADKPSASSDDEEKK